MFWLICRVSSKYKFEKPNHRPALELMSAAAKGVMEELPDVILAYGMSDEYRCFDLIERWVWVSPDYSKFYFS